METLSITATAPGKLIFLGEHAVNRGQMALAVSVGLYSSCTLALPHPSLPDGYTLETETHAARHTTREDILSLGQTIDSYLANGDYAAIQQRARADFFAPAKYVLAAFGEALPPTLAISFSSKLPPSAGLGSGGSIFVALSAALATLLHQALTPQELARHAVRGDMIAHGGTASGLDTQTSLYGGAIRYRLQTQGEPIPYAPGLSLVIGNTNLIASTSVVNGRVRSWLAAKPSRMHYFQEIGLLSNQAETLLRTGSWTELGHLLNLNQLILERIGVSCPELETLIEAALGAGALGAKLSGSGGGGVMFALTTHDTLSTVAEAITSAGGTALVVPISVPGVTVTQTTIKHDHT